MFFTYDYFCKNLNPSPLAIQQRTAQSLAYTNFLFDLEARVKKAKSTQVLNKAWVDMLKAIKGFETYTEIELVSSPVSTALTGRCFALTQVFAEEISFVLTAPSFARVTIPLTSIDMVTPIINLQSSVNIPRDLSDVEGYKYVGLSSDFMAMTFSEFNIEVNDVFDMEKLSEDMLDTIYSHTSENIIACKLPAKTPYLQLNITFNEGTVLRVNCYHICPFKSTELLEDSQDTIDSNSCILYAMV